MKKVVVVSGPGRSGTSLLAGALSHVGTRVSRPHLPALERTEQPSFETKWVVEHHQAMLRRDPVVRGMDARPDALELARTLPNAEDDGAINLWLGGVLHDAPTGQVVVNDPRAYWFRDHWVAAAHGLGVSIGFVTVLSDPVRFIRSRDVLRAAADNDPRQRRQRDTAFLAGWVHALLLVAETTRHDERAFVRHADLVADWRTTLAGLAGRVGLTLDLETGAGAVDELVGSVPLEPVLDWDAVDVPDALRTVAVDLWGQLDRLVDDPADASVPGTLATLRLDYERVFDHAVGAALDHTATREVQVSRRARAAADRDYETQVAELEQQLEEANSGTGDDEVDDRR